MQEEEELRKKKRLRRTEKSLDEGNECMIPGEKKMGL